MPAFLFITIHREYPMLEKLTHLKQLEAESIHIIREVAAEFQNPVMLYSVGKDSAVMLHLARKAFYPGRLPFPCPACRYRLEIPRDVQLPRAHDRRNGSGPAGTQEPRRGWSRA